MRILIVDDNPATAKTIARTLSQKEDRAFETVAASRLDEAMVLLDEMAVDVVLLKPDLPDSTGMDTVRRLRERCPALPIIALTDSDDQNLGIHAIQNGCQDFIVRKTLNPQMLWRILTYSLERKRAELALVEERARLRDYIDTSSEWFWEIGPDFRFAFVSDNCGEVLGIEPGAFIGRALPEIDGMALPGNDWSDYYDIVREGRAFRDLDLCYRIGPEDVLWLRLSGKPLYDRRGCLEGYRGVGRNITLDKFAEWELANKKALLEGILHGSHDAFLVLERILDAQRHIADFKIMHTNRRAEDLFGRPRVQLLGRLFSQEFSELMRYGLFERAVQTMASDIPFEVEQYYADGTLAGWYRVVGVRLDTKIVLTFSDVTTRIEAERDQRLAAAVFRTSHEALMVTDAHGDIISVNPAFTRLTGYTIEDVIGRNPRILSSGRHSRLFYAELWQALIGSGTWTGSITNRRRDGNVYVQRSSISVIRDDRGEIANFVCLASDVTQEYEEAERHKLRANCDPLTGLPNRFLLMDRLQHSLTKAHRDSRMVAVLFIDLDGFKPINDVYGHLAGDQVLNSVAGRLADCVRESDTVARLGGDEFVVVLLDIRHPEDAHVVADKIIDTICRPIAVGRSEVEVGASVGVAVCPRDGQEPEMLVRNADEAMYRAKNAGKGAWRAYSEG